MSIDNFPMHFSSSIPESAMIISRVSRCEYDSVVEDFLGRFSVAAGMATSGVYAHPIMSGDIGALSKNDGESSS